MYFRLVIVKVSPNTGPDVSPARRRREGTIATLDRPEMLFCLARVIEPLAVSAANVVAFGFQEKVSQRY